jgi:hypothetical protein
MSAQQDPSARQNPRTDKAPAKNAAAMVSFKGCLQATGQPDVFMFAVRDVPTGATAESRMASGTPPVTTGTTGDVAASSAPPFMNATFRLVGGNTAEMQKHVGHTVEVSGHVDKTALNTINDASSPGAKDSGKSARDTGPARSPELHVTAFKHVDTNCEKRTPSAGAPPAQDSGKQDKQGKGR